MALSFSSSLGGTAIYTGTIAGNTMTITAVPNPALRSVFLGPGVTISGTGVTAGCVIVANGTGTGGIGTYTLNNTSTVSTATSLSAFSSIRTAVSGQYATFTATAASTNTDAATWSVTGTLSNIQTAVGNIPAPTTALFVGRGVVRSSGTWSTSARRIDHSYIKSISGVSGTVTLTGTRQYLSDGTEDVFTVASGDVLQICGTEVEMAQGAAPLVTMTRSINDWSSYGGTRADIGITPGAPATIMFGSTVQGTSVTVSANSYLHLGWSDVSIYQGPNCQSDGSAAYSNTVGYLSVDPAAALLMGRLQTTITSGQPITQTVYPTSRFVCDTQAALHYAGSSLAMAGYTVLAMDFEGPAYSPKIFSNVTHVRQCRWSSFANTVNGVNSLWFMAGGVTTVDGLQTYGTGSFTKVSGTAGTLGGTQIIYSIANGGSTFNQNENSSTPFRIYGYTSKGAIADFGGWRNSLPTIVSNDPTQATGTFLQSWDSPLGTNVYVTSADITFSGGQQNANVEMWRRIMPTVTVPNVANPSGVVYLKDATRQVGGSTGGQTSQPNARGLLVNVVNQGGNQDNTGSSVISRFGATVLSDNAPASDDRTYVVASGGQTNVLLGELYSSNNPNDSSRLGRTGYDGGPSGISTTRISRRGKDDTQGSRTNRDNYDLFSWSYSGQFSKVADYSMNATANGNIGSVTIPQLIDTLITQPLIATTAAYTDLSATGRLYDYAKYYKTASGTINGRTQQQRLELGGVDGTDPTATIANGSGGYLVYVNAAGNLAFNNIFNSATLAGGISTLPFNVAPPAQGPVRGTWNGTTYTYGTNVPAIPTVQSGLTISTGTVNSIIDSRTMDFGAIPVTIRNQPATASTTYAPIKTTGNITLSRGIGANLTLTASNASSATVVSWASAGTVTVSFLFSGSVGFTPPLAASFNITTTAGGTLSLANYYSAMAGNAVTGGGFTIAAGQGFASSAWSSIGWSVIGTSTNLYLVGPQSSQWTTPPNTWTGATSGSATSQTYTLTGATVVGVNGTTNAGGTTNYQSLTYSQLSGLPTAGMISGGGSLLGGSWTVTLTGSPTPNTVSLGSTNLSGTNNFTLPDSSISILYVADNFVDNTVINVTGYANATGVRSLALTGCTIASGKTVTVNYAPGLGATDTLQVAVGGGTPLAQVIAGTNVTIVKSIAVTIDTTSYGATCLVFDSSGNILNTPATAITLPTTGASATVFYIGNADRIIIGSANNTAAYVPKIYTSTQINTGVLDATNLTATPAIPAPDSDLLGWGSTFVNGLLTFLVKSSNTGGLAGQGTAARIVRRFSDVNFLRGLEYATRSTGGGFTQAQYTSLTLILRRVTSVHT